MLVACSEERLVEQMEIAENELQKCRPATALA